MPSRKGNAMTFSFNGLATGHFDGREDVGLHWLECSKGWREEFGVEHCVRHTQNSGIKLFLPPASHISRMERALIM